MIRPASRSAQWLVASARLGPCAPARSLAGAVSPRAPAPGRALCASGPTRSVKTFPRKQKKQSAKERREARREALKAGEVERRPLVSAVMKKLYMMVHPDRFHTQPALAEANNTAFQQLSGFFTSIEKDTEFPPARRQELAFYVPDPERESGVREEVLVLETTGGNCKRRVGEALAEFFGRVGLPRDFEWDGKYWMYGLSLEDRRRDGADDDDLDGLHKQQAVADHLDDLDGVFQGLAAVPFLPDDHPTARRARSDFLKFLGEASLNIVTPVRQLWMVRAVASRGGRGQSRALIAAAAPSQGERNEEELMRRLTPVEKAALERVLLHTRAFEEQGLPRRNVDY